MQQTILEPKAVFEWTNYIVEIITAIGTLFGIYMGWRQLRKRKSKKESL